MKLEKLAAALAVILMMTVVAAPAVSAEDSVDLTATVLEPKPEIGIELNATALSFGSLYPGETSEPQDLKVTNIGLKEIDVTATASDEGTEPLFVPGLLIDNAAYGDYLVTLVSDESDDTQLALHVPDDYASRGDVSGGATFWAEEHLDTIAPSADFSATSLTGDAPLTVQFTDRSIDLGNNLPTAWEWDFQNDGTVDSYEQNPIYTYSAAGTYSVKLFVSNSAGSDDEVKSELITVNEAASPVTDFTYTSDGSSVTIIGYIGTGGNVIIPSVIEGLPVTSISGGAFYKNIVVTSVMIPDSVSKIDDYTFLECTSLTSVAIPGSVTSIGTSAFRQCTSLTSVTIPDSVTSIGSSLFFGCSALTSVTIGSGVTTINGSAFLGCSALTSITIPDSVTSIGVNAFQDCSALTSVTIGSGVSSIGTNALGGCSALTVINVDVDNNAYTSVDNVLYDKAINTLILCPMMKAGSLAIPDSVTSIGKNALYGCSVLTSITIPISVTSIGVGAFRDCTALTSVTIPNSVTSIGNGAFRGCTALTTVTIGSGVTTLGGYTFADCTALTAMTFMGNAPTVGSNWASNLPSTMIVYYYQGATGFTDPWNGFATEELTP